MEERDRFAAGADDDDRPANPPVPSQIVEDPAGDQSCGDQRRRHTHEEQAAHSRESTWYCAMNSTPTRNPIAIKPAVSR